MKKFILISLFVFISLQSLYSEGRRNIIVYPLSNPTNEKWIGNLGKSITDTVVLSLALMGNYNIKRPAKDSAAVDADNLESLAASSGMDNIIFGDCSVTDDGYRVSVSVYDYSKNKIVDTADEEFFSLLDSFDAADNISNVLIENLSGEKVYFGSLSVNTKSSNPFRTEINGVDVGYGFSGSDKVITGAHQLKFYQDRGHGEVLIKSSNVNIELRQKTEISLEIPWLTDKEAADFREIKKRLIRNYIGEKDPVENESLFSDAVKFYDNDFMKKYRPSISKNYEELRTVYSGPEISYSNYTSSLGVGNSSVVDKIFKDDVLEKSEEITGTGIMRKAEMFSRSFNKKYPLCSYGAEISVDGKGGDWDSIASVYRDETGDQESGYKETSSDSDLVRYGVAIDSRYLYLMVETLNETYSKKNRYTLLLSNNNVLMVQYIPQLNYSGMHVVPDKDWSKKRELSSSVKRASDEILEFAIPLSVLKKNINTETIVVDIEWIIEEEKDGWPDIDKGNAKVVIPTLYYELAEDLKTGE